MNGPLVSLCVPTYNAQATLGETLRSLLGQSYELLEVLVVDNASTDGTVALVESFADPRLKVHRSDRNIGAEANFTRCFRLAKGKYTAIYHSDDIYEQTIVAKQVSFLERHSETGAVFTAASLIDDEGRSIGAAFIPRRFLNPDGWEATYDFPTIFKAVMKDSNFLICPSAMVRTNIYQQEIVEWENPLFASSSDLGVWFRILQRHPIGILPERLVRYRLSTTHFSSNYHRRRTEPADFERVMDFYLGRESVQRFVGVADRANYRRLCRVDHLRRAVNLVLLGQEDKARELCLDSLSADAFLGALQGGRNLKALVLALFLRGTLALRAGQLSKSILVRLWRR